MNLLVRVFCLWVSHFFRPKLGILDESVLKLPVLPNDLDVYGHMNNGRYLTNMDLGRMDLILRTGLGRTARQGKWNPLVAAVSMQYRRPLMVFNTFELRTRILCWDEKWIYLQQRFERRGHVAAVGLVRGLFMGKVRVATSEVLKSLGVDPVSPPMPDVVRRWVESFRTEAPR